MKPTAEFTTSSPTETQQLAGEILSKVKDRNIICLYGELGSGKTTFVQGLAKALGIKERTPSPTFVLIKEYEVESKRQKKILQLESCNLKRLIHIDCYRINSQKDIKSVDLEEFWQDKGNLVIIEWADRIKTILPKERLDIRFEYVSERKRRIDLAASGRQKVSGKQKT